MNNIKVIFQKLHHLKIRFTGIRVITSLAFILVFVALPVFAWEQQSSYQTGRNSFPYTPDSGGAGGGLMAYDSVANAIYVAGGAYIPSAGLPSKFTTYKYDAGTGNPIAPWPVVHAAFNGTVLGLAVDSSGNVFVTGIQGVSGNYYLTTISYDSAGNVRWITPSSANFSVIPDTMYAIQTIVNSSVISPVGSSLFIGMGIRTSSDSVGILHLYKLNTTDGSLVSGWPVSYSYKPHYLEVHGIAIDPAGSFVYVTGRHNPDSWQGENFLGDMPFTAKFSATNGVIQSGWPQFLCFPGYSCLNSMGSGGGIAVDATGVYIGAQQVAGSQTYYQKCAIAKYNLSGVLQAGWPKPTTSTQKFVCNDLFIQGSNLYVAGQGTSPSDPSPYSRFVIKQFTTAGSLVKEFSLLWASIQGVAYDVLTDASGNLYGAGQSAPTSGIGGGISNYGDIWKLGNFWTLRIDTTPPSTPTLNAPTLGAGSASCNTVNLSWSAVSDNAGGSGIYGYYVYRGGVKINAAPTTSTSYIDNTPPLSGNTLYRYRVTAVDYHGNESALSNEQSITTTLCPPNLTVTINAPGSGTVGVPKTLSGTVTNAINVVVPSSTVFSNRFEIDRDNNGTVDESSSIVTLDGINGLASRAVSTSWTPSVVSANYRIRLCTDTTGVVSETNEADNCSSWSALFGIVAAPSAPVASAGSAHALTIGAAHTSHSGASATDADSNLSSYSWALTSCPSTCPTLSGTVSGAISGGSVSVPGPTYTPNVVGSYTLRLTVTDAGGLSGTSNVVETASAGASAPVVNIGPSHPLAVGVPHNPHAGASATDANGNLSSYLWFWYNCPTWPSCPALTGASGSISGGLSSVPIPGPSYTPNVAGTGGSQFYGLRLQVTDTTPLSTVSSLMETTVNGAPVANAGTGHSSIPTGMVHTHSGASATDADSNLSSYSWALTSCPSTCPTLSGTVSGAISGGSVSVPGPTYTPNVVGSYTLRLTVTDSNSLTNSSQVIETISNSTPDLVVSIAPTLNSGTLTEGFNTTFKATVKNAGTVATPSGFTNRFYVDLNNDGTLDVTITPDASSAALNTNSTAQVISGTWVAVRGTHRIVVCADTPNAIAETDESNNCSNFIGGTNPPQGTGIITVGRFQQF